jgi:hypothetical protein
MLGCVGLLRRKPNNKPNSRGSMTAALFTEVGNEMLDTGAILDMHSGEEQALLRLSSEGSVGVYWGGR